MVAARLANLPAHRPSDKSPDLGTSTARAAEMLNVGRGTVEAGSIDLPAASQMLNVGEATAKRAYKLVSVFERIGAKGYELVTLSREALFQIASTPEPQRETVIETVKQMVVDGETPPGSVFGSAAGNKRPPEGYLFLRAGFFVSATSCPAGAGFIAAASGITSSHLCTNAHEKAVNSDFVCTNAHIARYTLRTHGEHREASRGATARLLSAVGKPDGPEQRRRGTPHPQAARGGPAAAIPTRARRGACGRPKRRQSASGGHGRRHHVRGGSRGAGAVRSPASAHRRLR